ncbi:hypothetical protein [Legionella drozanskii]|uniref:Uncharacterized protein n=1 Tax=Legionella drozanskii LLAP-1 TaxID=1212489 RepID=A0A0W0SMI6_9GAMM|nr:hypothetical protein [Legionella drozanskii]KTC84526.1 hypothetical protein Ldro_2690 [Legionella drozanskii LLAP-1]
MRFPSQEDREQYRRGGEAGRRAAKFGRQKSKDFNNKPIPYQEGYDEVYARVKATMSQAEIETNREQDNRSKKVSVQQIKRRKTNHFDQSPIFTPNREQNSLMGSWDIKTSIPQSSVLQTQGNPVGFFEGEYFFEQNNLELNSENNPEEEKDLLEILEGENYLDQTDLNTLSGNPLKEEEELIEILKQLPPPNKSGEKVPNLTSFEKTKTAIHSHRGFYEPIHSTLLEHGLFSPSTAKNSSDNKKEMDNGSEISFY